MAIVNQLPPYIPVPRPHHPPPPSPSKCLQLDNVVRSSHFKHHTFVMPAFYFQNFAKFHFAHLDKDGTVVFSLPMAPTDMLTAFDVDDTGAAVVNALNNPDEWDVSGWLLGVWGLENPMGVGTLLIPLHWCAS